MAQAKSPLPNSFSLEWNVNLEPSGEQNGLPNFKQADVDVAGLTTNLNYWSEIKCTIQEYIVLFYLPKLIKKDMGSMCILVTSVYYIPIVYIQ